MVGDGSGGGVVMSGRRALWRRGMTSMGRGRGGANQAVGQSGLHDGKNVSNSENRRQQHQ